MLIELLRTRTRICHERLERDLDVDCKLEDVQTYAQLLQRFYGWYEPWERVVSRFPDERIRDFMSSRRKTELLHADLQWLGLEDELDSVPRAQEPAYQSSSELLGACYVLEGSTLGGQIISRMIEQRLGLRDGKGFSFYKGYGTATGERWKQFKAFAESHPAASESDSVAQSAERTFEQIRTWICEQ